MENNQEISAQNDEFKADFDKDRFVIVIVACKGGHRMSIRSVKDYKYTYAEIVGQLQIALQTLVEKITTENKSISTAWNTRPVDEKNGQPEENILVDIYKNQKKV